jgi:NMT1-like family
MTPLHHRLVMKFWLSRRGIRTSGRAIAAPPAPSSGKTGMGSLEHMVRSRVRMFLRHTWLVAILGTAVLVAFVWAAIDYTKEGDRLRIAAGPLDVRFVQALSDQVVKQHSDLRLQLVRTADAKKAAAAMSDHQADLAILPSPLDDALNWPVVAIVRQNVMALIVPPAPPSASKPAEAAASAPPATPSAKPEKATKTAKSAKAGKSAKTLKSAKGKPAKSAKSDDSKDSDDGDDSSTTAASDSSTLTKVAQLSGKRIGIVSGNEATKGLLEFVLNHYGVAITKVTVSEIAPTNLASAIKANQVDALFVVGPATGHAISDTVAAATQNGVAPTFIDIDQAEGIAKRDPAFDSIDIDAGTFGGNPPTPDDSLKSVSFPEYLVARKSFSDSAVAALAKALYTSRQSLALAMPGDVKVEAPSTDKDAYAVLHPGALAYLSDSQQSFFDKYGDDIFYGMLIFPVFGSAIAATASYLMRGTRTRRLRLLQKVLDLVRKAHAAQTVEALDQLQIDADNLVIAIIHQSEHEEFDESARMSFAFALDQLRFAIAARRTAIVDQSLAGVNAAPGGKAAAA